MVTIDIKSVQQILQKKINFGHTKRLSKKKSKSFVNHRYSIKMCFFFHIYMLEKYFKDKFTIKYFFTIHAHSMLIAYLMYFYLFYLTFLFLMDIYQQIL